MPEQEPASVLRQGGIDEVTHWARKDVDKDGDLDLILHFSVQQTGIACGATSARLTGSTTGGQAIQGSDSVQTTGC